jgi:hypothetical protein
LEKKVGEEGWKMLENKVGEEDWRRRLENKVVK